MGNNEWTVAVNGVDLCVRGFGDPADPAVLLLHGAGESMLAWDAEFVERLAVSGRYVVRYDSRDAGRSTTYPVGAPEYGLRDLVADAVGLITTLGLGKAHLVGMSQGSAVAQLVALDHPDLVSSLTIASGTPGGPGHEQTDLPGMTPGLAAFFGVEAPVPDWRDRDSVVEYLAESMRPFAAASRRFDLEAQREQARRLVDRAVDIGAQLTNPYLLDPGAPWRDRLGQIAVPTLVLHGTEDPLFPIGHGRALAAEITGARLVALEQTGHEVFPPHTWDAVVPELLAHTA
ncbi:alpha/beta fold hydrolase [Nocardia amikacinitolerans]|uniref:alpha/beta fold hydrolase n=1 Tax=Nocardia amikacinitolerans TaxID=756689 RepID=UPI0020A49439|nr:alpha/beta hydrolase [Nocardia amikacinitolerans]MCP2275368.1 Pimeloyl-ACP methyl ester carboxylesterase [Nocardia amikacinitolerans]